MKNGKETLWWYAIHYQFIPLANGENIEDGAGRRPPPSFHPDQNTPEICVCL